MTHAQAIAELRRTVEVLRDKLEEVELELSAFGPTTQPVLHVQAAAPVCGLTANELTIVAHLAAVGKPQTVWELADALALYRQSHPTDPEGLVRSTVSKLRRKAREAGVDLGIETWRGRGWLIRRDRLADVRVMLWGSP